MRLRKYRVVTDEYGGFEAQVWRLWWPFWQMINGINTNLSLKKAIALCKSHQNGAEILWTSEREND